MKVKLFYFAIVALFCVACSNNSTSSDDPYGEKFWSTLTDDEKKLVGVEGFHPNRIYAIEINEETENTNWIEFDLTKIKDYLTESIPDIDVSAIQWQKAESIESPQGKGLKAVITAPGQPATYLVYNIDDQDEGFAALEEVKGFDKICSDYEAVGTEGAVKMMIMTTVTKAAFQIFKTSHLEKDGKKYRILGIFYINSNH